MSACANDRRGAVSGAAQWPEECANLICQRLGLLHRREVPAARHHRPALDVAVSMFGQRLWWTNDLGRKLAVINRHVYGCALRHRPGAMLASVVGQKDEPIAPVNQYREIFASSSLRLNALSLSSPQSDHSLNFSVIYAARPVGESVNA